MRPLTPAALEAAAASAGLGTFSAVVRPLCGAGRGAALHENRALYPASMIKTPLAAAALALVEERELGFDQRVLVESSNATLNDAPSLAEPGSHATIATLIDVMLRRSDNTATNVLLDHVGRERATQIVRRWGLQQTFFRRKLSGASPLVTDPEALGRNAHPAADAALLFEALALGRIPYAHRLQQILGAQEWNEKLSQGLRSGDRFLHKTGDTSQTSHDGGILHIAEGRAYVVVVYTALPSAPANDKRLAHFMRLVRPLL